MKIFLKSKLYCLFHLANYRYCKSEQRFQRYLVSQEEINNIDLMLANQNTYINFSNLKQLSFFVEQVLEQYDESLIRRDYALQRKLIMLMKKLLDDYLRLEKEEGNDYFKIRVKLCRLIQIHDKKEHYARMTLKLVG